MSFRLRQWLNGWTLAAVVLLAGYAYVLYLVANPAVSFAYRAYFIERSSDLSPALFEQKVAALPPLALGQTYPHTAPDIVWAGWSSSESTHRWTEGRSATLSFRLPDALPSQAILVLEGFFLNGQQRVAVSYAGHQTDQVYRDGDDIVVPLMQSETSQAVTIQFDLPDAERPGANDARVLGFALQSLSLTARDD